VEVPTIRGPLAFGDILSPGALLFHPLSGARLEHALGGQATLTVIVGPEGGFAPAEIDAALAAGCRLVGLGPRVLRAETAAVVVCGLCQYLWGDLGPIESD
jgi:16S rRNA (uracil1498-N3)-methyltransferase